MTIPLYKKEDIIKAIEDEGLVSEAWGFKTPYCIWIYHEGMENNEIWDKFPTPLRGFEKAFWDADCIETSVYFLLEGYKGNLNRLPWEIEHPLEKKFIPDDE